VDSGFGEEWPPRRKVGERLVAVLADGGVGKEVEVGGGGVLEKVLERDSILRKCAVVEVEGAGLGLVVTGEVAAGEVLVEESPLITLVGEGKRSWFLQTLRQVAKLAPQQREELRRLAPHHSPLPLYLGIVANNVISLGGDFGVFLAISRINHSCRPNCRHSQGRVVAARRLRRGEEVTISYIADQVATAAERAAELAYWGFVCRCEACLGPGVAAGMARVGELAALVERLQDEGHLVEGDAGRLLRSTVYGDILGVLGEGDRLLRLLPRLSPPPRALHLSLLLSCTALGARALALGLATASNRRRVEEGLEQAAARARSRPHHWELYLTCLARSLLAQVTWTHGI